MDSQSWAISVIVIGEDTQSLRSLKVYQFSPERAGIATLQWPFFDHYFIGHLLRPGIKLLDMYAQKLAQFSRIATQDDMIVLIYNPTEECRKQYPSLPDKLLQVL